MGRNGQSCAAFGSGEVSAVERADVSDTPVQAAATTNDSARTVDVTRTKAMMTCGVFRGARAWSTGIIIVARWFAPDCGVRCTTPALWHGDSAFPTSPESSLADHWETSGIDRQPGRDGVGRPD